MFLAEHMAKHIILLKANEGIETKPGMNVPYGLQTKSYYFALVQIHY